MTIEKLTLDTAEIQKITGFGRDHIKKLVRDGKLPNLGNSKRFIVARAALLRYLEGQK